MDYISQRITSISNGQKASQRKVVFQLSGSVGRPAIHVGGFKLLASSLELLRREGYIRAFNFSMVKRRNQNKVGYAFRSDVCAVYLTIYLKYDAIGNSAIRSIFRTSTSGRRVSISARSFWQPQASSGIFVLSTSQGLRTDVEARRRNLGGELFFGVV